MVTCKINASSTALLPCEPQGEGSRQQEAVSLPQSQNPSSNQEAQSQQIQLCKPQSSVLCREVQLGDHLNCILRVPRACTPAPNCDSGYQESKRTTPDMVGRCCATRDSSWQDWNSAFLSHTHKRMSDAASLTRVAENNKAFRDTSA